MAIGSILQVSPFTTKPSAPPAGSYEMYVKIDNTIYLQDSFGNEYAFGSTTAITQLTGDVTAIGPGTAAATIQAIQGNTVSGTTGTINVAFSNSPTFTGTIVAVAANFSSAISASNFSGNSSGTNTGDVTVTNTNSIDLAFTSGQTGLSANLNLSVSSPDAGYIPALSEIKTDGLLVEVLAGIPVQIGTSNGIGSAASASRSDHVHAITSPIVLGLLLTGYTTGTNTPILATNSILIAFENLQAQISATSGSAITALTGDVLATGPGSVSATIQPNVVTNSKLAQMTANTVKANITGSTANASDVSLGTVTETTSSVLTLSGWTDATVGSPTITVKQSSAVQSGYLSSTDWNIFNNKQTAGNYITALTGDVTATGPGSSAATVVAIQGTAVSNTTPTDAQILIYNSGTAKWTPESLSGDILITNLGVSTIQPNVVTNSKLAQVPANTLKGNNTGSTANVTDLTISQVNTMLGNVTTVGSYNGGTANANAASIVGNSIFFQSASTSFPGMVDITTQSFAGNKTFTGTVSITPSSTSALIINTTSFIFDSVNNAQGIGVQPATNTFLDGVNSTGAAKRIQLTGYGTGSSVGYRGRFARGTSGSPTAAQTGDNLSFFSGQGYGASTFPSTSTGAINIVAGENFTNTSNLTYIAINATPTGSVTSAESMRIASTGVTLGPQSSSTAIHQINGGVNQTTRTVTAATLTVDTTTTDYIIFTDSTSNAITITLPTATNGRVLIIRDKTGEAATNHITITPPGAVTINGVNASITIGTNYAGWMLMSDGTNWTAHVISPNVPAQAIAATSIDWNTATMFTKTLAANTTFTFANAVSGQTIVVRLTNTASNYTVTWPTVRWAAGTAPTMSTGAVSDVYSFIYDGSNFYGSYIQNMS